jgi:hypothetical protein
MFPKAPLPAFTTLALALLAGCSASSTDIVCGGVAAPADLHVGNVTPAIGATVTNDAIVHSFSVLDNIAFDDVVLDYPLEHTAGASDPDLKFSYQLSATSSDYTAAAVTWATAPGHVEINSTAIYQTPDGCGYRLPNPLFSYDVVAPGTDVTPATSDTTDGTDTSDTPATSATPDAK